VLSDTAIEKLCLFRRKIICTVLAILYVLTAKMRGIEPTESLKGRSIPLTKLLKSKTTMTKDLWTNGSGSVDLKNDVGHLKHGPMLMADTVTKKLLHGLVILLVAGVRHPGTIGNGFFCIWCDADELYRRSVKH